MLYIVPIEPLEERYSADWLRWVKQWAAKNDVDRFIIEPRTTYKKIQRGQFLDVIGTNNYKAKQLDIITQLFQDGYVKNDDIFWVHDLWFPGIEMLAYMRNGLGMKFKIFGMLHAGTYDPHDFTTQCKMRSWGQHLEASWLSMADGVFVATQFHKELLRKHYSRYMHKVHKVPFPMYWDKTYPGTTQKEKLIVFPHRLAPEKGIKVWEQFREIATANGWECKVTKNECDTKEQYYDLLRKAKYAVSFAKQETWGIAMQEAVFYGCVPIVPDDLSYKEMYYPDFKYSNNVHEMQAQRCWDKLVILELYYERSCELVNDLRNDFIIQGHMSFSTMYNIMRGGCL